MKICQDERYCNTFKCFKAFLVLVNVKGASGFIISVNFLDTCLVQAGINVMAEVDVPGHAESWLETLFILFRNLLKIIVLYCCLFFVSLVENRSFMENIKLYIMFHCFSHFKIHDISENLFLPFIYDSIIIDMI